MRLLYTVKYYFSKVCVVGNSIYEYRFLAPGVFEANETKLPIFVRENLFVSIYNTSIYIICLIVITRKLCYDVNLCCRCHKANVLATVYIWFKQQISVSFSSGSNSWQKKFSSVHGVAMSRTFSQICFSCQ
jgi:hypothetical protein